MKLASKLLTVVALFVAVALVQAADSKDAEKTMTGTITCAKCDLKKEADCATVLVVKDKAGKEKIYYFDADSHKKFHKEVCQEAKEGTVTGKVSKDGKKLIIAASKVDYK